MKQNYCLFATNLTSLYVLFLFLLIFLSRLLLQSILSNTTFTLYLCALIFIMQTPPQTPNRRSADSPPATSCMPAQKKPKKYYSYSCICDWGDLCEEAYFTFQERLSDPWKGKPFESKLNKKSEPLLKVKAYRKAVLNLFNQEDIGQRFTICRHHFSRVMFTEFGHQRTKLLEQTQVRYLDNDNRVLHNGYEVTKFTVYSLLTSEPEVKAKPNHWKAM